MVDINGGISRVIYSKLLFESTCKPQLDYSARNEEDEKLDNKSYACLGLFGCNCSNANIDYQSDNSCSM